MAGISPLMVAAHEALQALYAKALFLTGFERCRRSLASKPLEAAVKGHAFPRTLAECMVKPLSLKDLEVATHASLARIGRWRAGADASAALAATQLSPLRKPVRAWHRGSSPRK